MDCPDCSRPLKQGLINQIKPAAVIPTHYGSIVGKPEDADAFRKLTDGSIQVITKL